MYVSIRTGKNREEFFHNYIVHLVITHNYFQDICYSLNKSKQNYFSNALFMKCKILHHFQLISTIYL